jgi:hypothetical protein
VALMSNAGQAKKRSMTEWLQLLDADLAVAEQKYAELFRGLARYFEWNRGSEPEDMAQETLHRGLIKLADGGVEITIDDVRGYFWGIAHNVLREGWTPKQTVAIEDREFPVAATSFRQLNKTEQVIFLRECLKELDVEDREMLLAYAEGEGARWAEARGLSRGALRLRIHRLRRELELLAAARKINRKRPWFRGHVRT